MKKLFLALIILGSLEAIAQKIGSNEALSDLNFLLKNIKEYSPTLSYSPEFDNKAQDIIQNTSGDSISLIDLFSKVSRICALVNEGHLKIGDWDDTVHVGFSKDGYTYLPLKVKVVEDRLYVDKDYSNEQGIDTGSEIITINGLEANLILNKLLETTPSDGSIKTYAYRKIEEGFPWRYYLYVQRPDTFNITFRTNSQEVRKVSITALDRSQQIENFKKYYPKKEDHKSAMDRFYTLDIQANYALLTLPSFDFRRANKFEVESKKLYKTLFKELRDKGVNHLIVDLRNNTGGRNEFADDMVPFINQNNQKDLFLKKTISWAGKTKVYKMPKTSKLVFKGSIYVLVNGKTFSAGNSLARYLKEYGNATVIGTETGTRYEGFAAGSNQHITLPNSKLSVKIPRYHILYPPSQKQMTSNRGLLPDYEINTSYDFYFKGEELHLKKAIFLIEAGR